MFFLFTCYIFLKGGASYITNHIYIYIYTHTHATDKIFFLLKGTTYYLLWGMVKGSRPNGDMGYVHCALTPPLRNPGSISQHRHNICKEHLQSVYTTVAYTVYEN